MTDVTAGINLRATDEMSPTVRRIAEALTLLENQTKSVGGSVSQFDAIFKAARVDVEAAIPAIARASEQLSGLGKNADPAAIQRIVAELQRVIVAEQGVGNEAERSASRVNRAHRDISDNLERHSSRVITSVKGMADSFGIASTGAERFVGSFATLAGAAGPAGIGIGVVAGATIGLAKAFTDAAVEIEDQEKNIRGELTALGEADSWDKIRSQLEGQREAGVDVGASFLQLEQGYARLLERTDDATQALEANNIALQFADTTGLKYEASLTRVGSALDGNARVLHQFGINLTESQQETLKHLDASEKHAVILDLLKQRTEAQSTAQKTTKDSLNELGARMDNFRESTGAAMLGSLQGIAGAALAGANAFDQLGRALESMRQAAPLKGAGGDDPVKQFLTDRINDLNAVAAAADRAGVNAITGEALPARTAPVPERTGAAPPVVAPAGAPTGFETEESTRGGRDGAGDYAARIFAEGEARRAAYESAKKAATDAEKEIRREATETGEHIRTQYRLAVRDAEDSAKGRIAAQRDIERVARETATSEKAVEQDRYTAEQRAMRDAQQTEQDGFARRKEVIADWFSDAKQKIDDRKTADLEAIREAEATEKASFTTRAETQRTHYDRLKTDLEDTQRARERGAEAAKRSIDDQLKADEAAEKQRAQAVIDGLKARQDAMERLHTIQQFLVESAHRAQMAALDAEAEAERRTHEENNRQLERDHQANLTRIGAEHQANLDRIKTEQQAQEDAIRAQVRAIDEVGRARKFAEAEQEAGFGISRAQYELAQAQATGDRNQVLQARQALQRAQFRQVDVTETEVERQQRQYLGDQGEGIKRAADAATAVENARNQAAETAEKTRYQNAQDAERQRYQLVEDAEKQKRDQAEETYRNQVFWWEQAYKDARAQTDRQITEAERERDAKLAALQAEATERKRVIDDNTKLLQDWTREQIARLDVWNKAELKAISDEQTASEAYWNTQRANVASWELNEKRQLDADHTERVRQLGVEEAAAQKRWQTDKDSAATAHIEIMAGIEARQNAVIGAAAAEITAIQGELEQTRRDLEAAYGDQEGGLLWQLKRVEAANLAQIDAEKENLADKEAQAHATAAQWQEVENRIRGALGAFQEFQKSVQPPVTGGAQPTAPGVPGGGAGDYSQQFRTPREFQTVDYFGLFGAAARESLGGLVSGASGGSTGGPLRDQYYLEQHAATVDRDRQATLDTIAARVRETAAIEAAKGAVEGWVISLENASAGVGDIAAGPGRGGDRRPATTLAQIVAQASGNFLRYAVPGIDDPFESGGPVQAPSASGRLQTQQGPIVLDSRGVPVAGGRNLAQVGTGGGGVAGAPTFNITVNVDGKQSLNATVQQAAGSAQGGGVGVTWGGSTGGGRE